MGRLIDATILFEAVERSKENNNHKDAIAKSVHRNEHNHFLYMICQQPTVGARLICTAELKEPTVITNVNIPTVIGKCSNCGLGCFQEVTNYKINPYKFCPYCGAEFVKEDSKNDSN